MRFMVLRTLPAALVGLLAFASSTGWCQKLGTVRAIEKQVLLSSPGSRTFSPVHLKASFVSDQSLRTMRRSKAALNFVDGYELRVNEMTELVLQSTAQMRRVQLGSGAVWLRVKKGVSLQVETPTFTAAVRGTEFEVDAQGEVRVYEGVVGVTPQGGTEILIEAGNKAEVEAGQLTELSIPKGELPVSYRGARPRWWESIVLDREDLIGTDPLVSESPLLPKSPSGGDTKRNHLPSFVLQPTDREFISLGGAGAIALLGLSERGIGWSVGASLDAQPLDSGFVALRGDAQVSLGNSQLNWRPIHLQRTDTNAKVTELDHVLFAERKLTAGVTLRSGRFHHHPSAVRLDYAQQSVAGGLYSGAILQMDQGPYQASLGWIGDGQPATNGRQSAWIGSAKTYTRWGTLEANLAHSSTNKDYSYGFGTGAPLLPGWLDAYAEVAFTNRDRRRLLTVGAHLPFLEDRFGWKTYLEFQHNGTNRKGSLALWASKDLSERFQVSSHLGAEVGGPAAWGVGLSVRF